MKKVLVGFLICVLFSTCEKSVPVNLTDYDKPTLVAEGRISNTMEIQKFQITSTANLGSTNAAPVNDVLLTVKTPDGTVQFISQGQGIYESEIPFAGIAGEWYTIDLLYNGITHSVTTQMAAEIDVTYCSLSTANGIYTLGLPAILLELTSAQKQHFRYDIFKLDKYSPDSNWINLGIPVYETHVAESGSYLYSINQVNSSSYYLDSTDVARIIVYSLSEDVALYLSKLKSFMNYEPKGGRYENPPYYFTNEAYGLGYGSVVDTAYFSF